MTSDNRTVFGNALTNTSNTMVFFFTHHILCNLYDEVQSGVENYLNILVNLLEY